MINKKSAEVNKNGNDSNVEHFHYQAGVNHACPIPHNHKGGNKVHYHKALCGYGRCSPVASSED